MKQRITSLDLKILCNELEKEILNYRLQNIYSSSGSSKQYLLKFAVPDSKRILFVDSGDKLYTTRFERPTTDVPSNFATKLRKHLKSRRLSGLKQVGNDRIVVLEFSDGLYYLVFEFFSAGNVILLDKDRKILSLQRVVIAKSDNGDFAVNETYNMFDEMLFKTPKMEINTPVESEDIKCWILDHKNSLNGENNPPTSESKKKKVYSIHKLLFQRLSFLSGELIKHYLMEYGITPNESCLNYLENDKLDLLKNALTEAQRYYKSLFSETNSTPNTGYIVMKKNELYNPEDETLSGMEFIMDQFYPFKPSINSEQYRIKEVMGYSNTLDEYFSTIDSIKYTLRAEQQKQQAIKRLDTAKDARNQQIQSLLSVQEVNKQKGDAILYNADLVDKCCAFIRNFVSQQMDWTNIESLVQLEKKRGNRLAKMVNSPLKLEEGKISLYLTDEQYQSNGSDVSESESPSDFDDSSSDSEFSSTSEEDLDTEDEETSTTSSKVLLSKKKVRASPEKEAPKGLTVWVDINISPYANARNYFESKKDAETKRMKVEEKSDLALRNAKKKIEQDLARKLKQETDSLKEIRPKFWFEKFYWFISSERYLCLAGRDNNQTDMIYYRYFGDNDSFVSSDVEGSLKVFIKNPFEGEDIPPSTLIQAGIFSLAASVAWDGKVTTSAWTLPATSISKKNLDGSLVPSGSFTYTSEKRFLPHTQVVMGFALAWIVDEETNENYRAIRLDRQKELGFNIITNNEKAYLKGETINSTRREEPVNAGGNGEFSSEEKFISGITDAESPSTTVSSLVSATDSISLDSHDSYDNLTSKPTNIVRGKKSKLKKIARKYADQDEEDKILRMKMLGTYKQLGDNEKKNKLSPQDALNDILIKKKKAEDERKKQEAKEYRKYLNEENEESAITDYLEIMDSIVLKPKAGDQLVNVLPVFAPWSSLSKAKYKVKIQSGNGKKGKCIKDCLHYFASRKTDVKNSNEDMDWAREHELLKNVSANDCVSSFMVTSVKLSLPGNSDKSKNGKSLKDSQKKRK